jgi:predicted nucleic acid-binding protein
MKYVVDSSVGFKWVLVENLSDKARKLRDDYTAGIHRLLAPDVFPVEIAHALTRAERQKRITPPEGGILLADVLRTLPIQSRSLPLLLRAAEISLAMRVGVYDCLYVALAEKRKCRFITADDRLIKNLQVNFPFIISLASI